MISATRTFVYLFARVLLKIFGEIGQYVRHS